MYLKTIAVAQANSAFALGGSTPCSFSHGLIAFS